MLTGTAARSAATAIDSARPGTVPDDSSCVADAFNAQLVLHVRRTDGTTVEAWVRTDGCTDRWVATPTGGHLAVDAGTGRRPDATASHGLRDGGWPPGALSGAVPGGVPVGLALTSRWPVPDVDPGRAVVTVQQLEADG